jgi:hypothetical protein
MSHTVTFVTSFLKIYKLDYDENKSFEKRFVFFMKIVELGICICIFTSPEYADVFHEVSRKYPNLKVVQILSIEELIFTRIGKQHPNLIELPQHRSHQKDSSNYMFLMHAKIEFIQKTILLNPFHHSVFAWVDFSLPYIFQNLENSLHKLESYATKEYIKTPFLAMPGCWQSPFGDLECLRSQVCWRFCGGFFIGDKASLLHFYETSVLHFSDFLHITTHMVWEVNFWAWLEAERYLNPIWYLADHNDSIICIPHAVCATCLDGETEKR